MKRIILLGLLSFSLFSTAQEKESKLTNFAFLIGDFEFKGKTLKSKTEYNHYNGIWKSHYILDDTVIEEDFKIIGGNGGTTFHGLTLRSFNSKTNEWVMGFFDALNPKWYPLGQPEFKDGTISFKGNLPGLQPGQLLQVTFYDLGENTFKWKSDISPDNGKTWIYDFTVIEATRK
ncbi:hypothetical protein ACOKFD_07670 [Flagellimonas sp. S174]|uniref:hypothetical protein n=1 Tax=Flagellimonas sp. S174 TaxID=3410790 RepID=UPI003BF61A12